MSTRTNCICNSPDTGYAGPCPAHPKRMITSKATLCPDCGDEHGDKPAATGSGEPKKLKHVVNGDERGGWYCYACRFSSRNVSEAAAHDGTFTTPDQSEYATFTPPASQPTVTLGRADFDKVKWAIDAVLQLPSYPVDAAISEETVGHYGFLCGSEIEANLKDAQAGSTPSSRATDMSDWSDLRGSLRDNYRRSSLALSQEQAGC